MIYLASPYTAPTKEGREERYQSVLRVCGKLLKERHNVWSPIVHCHTMAVLFDLPTDFVFWKQYNHDFIRRADAVWVACIDGWSVSKGVDDEIKFAELLDMPVKYVHENKDGTLLIEP